MRVAAIILIGGSTGPGSVLGLQGPSVGGTTAQREAVMTHTAAISAVRGGSKCAHVLKRTRTIVLFVFGSVALE